MLDITQLKLEVNKLSKMLENPQPGMYGFMCMLADQLDKVAEFAPSYKAVETLSKVVEQELSGSGDTTYRYIKDVGIRKVK